VTPGAVDLRPVEEETLERLIVAALADASADKVIPPLGGGGAWTAERIDWLRTLHRERRAGLDGPAGEATWAVVADGEVVGAVRLKWTGEPGVPPLRSAQGAAGAGGLRHQPQGE
jgi:ribosomal-protein-alanine N-acetyltransferase